MNRLAAWFVRVSFAHTLASIYLSRGLSRDDRDDLLSGDMSALHLSENDVYTRTTGQVFPQRQNVSDTSEWDDRLGMWKIGES